MKKKWILIGITCLFCMTGCGQKTSADESESEKEEMSFEYITVEPHRTHETPKETEIAGVCDDGTKYTEFLEGYKGWFYESVSGKLTYISYQPVMDSYYIQIPSLEGYSASFPNRGVMTKQECIAYLMHRADLEEVKYQTVKLVKEDGIAFYVPNEETGEYTELCAKIGTPYSATIDDFWDANMGEFENTVGDGTISVSKQIANDEVVYNIDFSTLHEYYVAIHGDLYAIEGDACYGYTGRIGAEGATEESKYNIAKIVKGDGLTIYMRNVQTGEFELIGSTDISFANALNEEDGPTEKWYLASVEGYDSCRVNNTYTFDEAGKVKTKTDMWGDITEYDGNRTTYSYLDYRWTREKKFDKYGNIISETFVSPSDGGAGEKFFDEDAGETPFFDEYYEYEYDSEGHIIAEHYKGITGDDKVYEIDSSYLNYIDGNVYIKYMKIHMDDPHMGAYDNTEEHVYTYDEEGRIATQFIVYTWDGTDPKYASSYETQYTYHYSEENPELIDYLEHDGHIDYYTYVKGE